jgi:hypothetical protein
MFDASETSQPITFTPPSLWFWVKAGAGFGVGFLTMAIVFAFIYGFLALGFVGAVARAMTHH